MTDTENKLDQEQSRTMTSFQGSVEQLRFFLINKHAEF